MNTMFINWDTHHSKHEKLIYRINPIPIKLPIGYSIDIDKLILKYMWKRKGTKIVKIILKKKNKEFGRIVQSEFGLL